MGASANYHDKVRIDVHRLRTEHGLTIRGLALALRVGVTTANQWDKGTQPSAPILPAMARLFGCTIEELYEEVDE